MNPKSIPGLESIATTLEAYFGDMCDVDFTVQEGKLYILAARVGKRSPLAAIRIATDLFLERRITGKELITRISPDKVRAFLRPVIEPSPNIQPIGTGLPASGGAASGMSAFSTKSVLRLASTGAPVIFLCTDYTPEDIAGLEAAAGIVSFQGGMTSHEAIISHGMGKPCVTGTGWFYNPARKHVVTPSGDVQEREYVTVDGTLGLVFRGAARVKQAKGLENERLVLILRIIDLLACENHLPPTHVGAAWLIRDLITSVGTNFNSADTKGALREWPSNRRKRRKYIAFGNLSNTQVRKLANELLRFRLNRDFEDPRNIWAGLRSCLLRLLAQHVGVGNHPNFYRPLFDPTQATLNEHESAEWECQGRIQFVGEEFFSVNHYVPQYIDVECIRLYWGVECDEPTDLWRIDHTNPRGENLLQGGSKLVSLKVVINGADVSPDALPQLYNYLRKKEYFGDWYNKNGVSSRAIADLLSKRPIARGFELLYSAGLVSADRKITSVGRSFLQPSSAMERAGSNLTVGW